MKFFNAAKAVILAMVIALLGATFALSQETKFGDLIIHNPTIRATPPNAPVSGGYMKITNTGTSADRLIGGSVSFASKVEIHEMTMDNDIMKMRKLGQGLEIPAGGEVILKRGGLHVMFMKLNKQMKAGEVYKVKLNFQNAGDVEVEFEVKPISSMHKKMDHSKMGHSTKKMDHSKMKHGAHDHATLLSLPNGSNAPTLDFSLAKDNSSGWNLHIITTNFRFAPQAVSSPHVAGEGHAHIYVNGEKLARVYGPWFHIASLPKGETMVTITLNANNHSPMAVGEKALSVVKRVVVK